MEFLLNYYNIIPYIDFEELMCYVRCFFVEDYNHL